VSVTFRDQVLAVLPWSELHDDGPVGSSLQDRRNGHHGGEPRQRGQLGVSTGMGVRSCVRLADTGRDTFGRVGVSMTHWQSLPPEAGNVISVRQTAADMLTQLSGNTGRRANVR
jgi:hypothetical protein